jgi:hypothetical protein
MPARRMAALAAPWILVLGLTRGVVTLPERCPPAAADQTRTAAIEAVGWFERNQRDDGHWIYRYDRDADEVNRQDHVVRQAGITLSLYQAHAAGIPGALEPADEGVEWLLGELVRHDDWAAVERDGLAPTGGTALLVAALSTRRAATDEPRFDTELEELGQFLVAMTEPSGAVAANWDVGERRPVPGEYSKFFTGEAYFALALLDTVDPGAGWDATAARIGDYLTDRDDTEDRFPPTTDHWAAYGLAQSVLGADRPLDDEQSAYAERLAGLFGVEVRFESQRTGEGLNYSVLRGPNVVGAGLGTIGEGLGSLWRLSAVDDGLAGDRAAISERLRCVAGMLVDRQVTAAEAAESGHPGLARGAWFYKDLTQMDDQQHSLSALLLAEPALAEEGAAAGGAESSDDDVSAWRAVWLAVIALAAVNPPRVRRLVGRIPAATAIAGSMAAGGVTALVAAAGGPLLRALDVSPATGLIGAGLIVAMLGVIDAVRRPGGLFPAAGPGDGLLVPLLVPALLRPSVALLALTLTADAGWVAGGGVAIAVAAAGAVALLPSPAGGDRPAWGAALAEAACWGVAAVAIVGGIDLAVHGVLGV